MIRRDHGRAALLARPSILPAFWQDALDGLRPDGWLPGEEVPLDLVEIVRANRWRSRPPAGSAPRNACGRLRDGPSCFARALRVTLREPLPFID